jgi:hypothetical protein
LRARSGLPKISGAVQVVHLSRIGIVLCLLVGKLAFREIQGEKTAVVRGADGARLALFVPVARKGHIFDAI